MASIFKKMLPEEDKPPLGIMPKFIWNEKRLSELILAIQRYLNVEMPIPIDWIEEYNNLINERNKRTSL